MIIYKNNIGYPKCVLSNPCDTISFVNDSKNEIWSLLEYDEKNFKINYNAWLKYILNEDNQTFEIKKIEIPESIKLGTFNQIFHDTNNDQIIVISGTKYKKYVEHSAKQIESNQIIIYKYCLKSNNWNKIFEFEPEFELVKLIDMKNDQIFILFRIAGEYQVLVFNTIQNNYKLFLLPAELFQLQGFSLVPAKNNKLIFYGGFDKNNKCHNELYILDNIKFSIINKLSINDIKPRTFAFSAYLEKREAVLFYAGTPDGYESADDGFIYNINDYKILKLVDLFGFNATGNYVYDSVNESLYLLDTFKFDPIKRQYFYGNNGIGKIKISELYKI